MRGRCAVAGGGWATPAGGRAPKRRVFSILLCVHVRRRRRRFKFIVSVVRIRATVNSRSATTPGKGEQSAREVKTGRFRIKVPFCQNDYYLAMHITPTRATHATHAHTIVRSNNTDTVCGASKTGDGVGGDGGSRAWRRRSATVGDSRRRQRCDTTCLAASVPHRCCLPPPMKSWRNILRTAQACASRSRQRRGRALCGGPRYGAVEIAPQQAAGWVQQPDRCSLTHLRALGV